MKNRSNIIIIVILTLVTFMVWNASVFSAFISLILPGDVANQSILSTEISVSMLIYILIILAFRFAAPAILVFISISRIKECSYIPDLHPIYKIWYFAILLLNVLYYIFLFLLAITKNPTFFPDITWRFYGFYQTIRK